jgi:hypothetical protein
VGRRRRLESKALEHAYERCGGKDPDKAAAFEDELANTEIARERIRTWTES